MPAPTTTAHPARLRVVVTCLVVAAVAIAACTSDEDSAPTTTTSTTTTAPPPTTEPAPPEPEEPPQAAWIVQVGSPANDSLLGAASRGAEVLATGYTEGDLPGPGSGARDVLVVRVSTEGELLGTDQAGGAGTDSALGVGSAAGTTITCGYTEGDFGAPNAGSADAWCAPVDASGLLGAPVQQGGSEWDRLYGVAIAEDGTFGYSSGYTLGLFPGAADTSSGVLGNGDALLWQVNSAGSPTWIRQFGTEATDWAQGVATTTEGDAVVVGFTNGSLSGPSFGGQDGFLSRWDSSGLPRWIRQFGTDALDWPKGVAVGGEATRGTDTYVVVGNTEGTLAPPVGGPSAVEPGVDGEATTTTTTTTPGTTRGADAFVTAYDSAGDPRWTTQLGSLGAEDAIGVGVDGTTVLVSGNTTGALDTTGAPNAGGKDGFLAALDLESGRVRWITQFGSDGDEDVYGLTITGDGLAVVVGQTTGQLGDQPNAGGADGFLIAFPLPFAGGSVASAL